MLTAFPLRISRRVCAGRLARVIRVAAVLCMVGTAPVWAQDEDAVAAEPEKPFAAMSRMLLGKGDSVAALAKEQVGLKYRWGAQQPGKAFDCSGLVRFVLSSFNLALPRTARDQAKLGTEVPKDPAALKPGDLLYFGKGKKVTHIGIYVGDGRYVHAANRRKGVIESKLPVQSGGSRRTFWRGVRRLLNFPDSTAGPSLQAADTMQVPVSTMVEVTGGGR